MIYDTSDCIIACSSGNAGNSAISVIRLSGKNVLDLCLHLFSKDLRNIKARYAYFTKLIFKESVLDEVVLTYFKAPRSYTGEDILEIGVHGNQFNVKRIIDVFCTVDNIRPAKAGEFSFRALQNNKLNLSQVEGLDLLLNATSIFSLEQGLSLMSGNIQADFHQLYTDFLNHKSAVEFGFDFLEDIGEDKFNSEFTKTLKNLSDTINRLHSSLANSNFNLLTPEIVVYGPPNAGKSTLFNILLDIDRAITSSTPGTTRDYLRENLFIGGAIFNLIDTAGIRQTQDRIESEGVKRSQELLKKSFIKILILNPLENNNDFVDQLTELDFDIILFSHNDLAGYEDGVKHTVKKLKSRFQDCGPIEPKSLIGPIGANKSSGSIEPLLDSGPIGAGLKSGSIEPVICCLTTQVYEIKEFIFDKIQSKYEHSLGTNPLLVDRHVNSIKNIYNEFVSYKKVVESESDMAIISSELNILGHCISELIGIVSPNDVLHNIFNNFCIGK